MRYLVYARNVRELEGLKDVIYAGEWCLDEVASDGFGYFENKFILPASNRSDINSNVFKTYNESLPNLISKLESYHEIELPERLWKILLGSWLWRICTIIEEVKFKLELSKKLYNCEEVLINTDTNNMNFLDTSSMLSNWKSVETLRSIIIKIIAPTYFDMEVREFQTFDNPMFDRDNVLNEELNLDNESPKCNFGGKKFYNSPVNVFFWDSYLNRRDLLLIETLLYQLPGSSLMLRKIYQNHLRYKLSEFFGDTKISSFAEMRQMKNSIDLSSFIYSLLPYSFLENFHAYRNTPREVGKLPKNIFSANALHDDDLFKFITIEVLENGGKLYYGQHGGGYGILKEFWAESFEREVADAFFTWGWKDNQHPKDNVIPLGLFTSRERANQKQTVDRGKYIVLLAQNYPSINVHTDSVASGELFIRYVEDNFKFIEALNWNEFRSIKVKLYANNYDRNQEAIWNKRIPNGSIIGPAQSIEETTKSTSLLVIGYCSTGFVTFISSDIPTVVFLNNEYYGIRNSATKFFVSLKSVGILHHDPTEAANFINSLNGDFIGWWHSKEVSKVRTEFKYNFAKEIKVTWDPFVKYLRVQ